MTFSDEFDMKRFVPFKRVFLKKMRPLSDRADLRDEPALASVLDRVVIGTGTSAAVYSHSAGKVSLPLAIGLQERWGKMSGDHRMGQPEHELVLDSGKEVSYSEEFLRAKDYVADLEGLKTFHLKLLDSAVKKVTDVEIGGTKVKQVELTTGAKILAFQVVVATGPGASRVDRSIKLSGLDEHLTPTTVRAPEGFLRCVDGDTFMSADISVPENGKIAIFGGSATAAWCCEEAMKRGGPGTKIYWFTREGGSEFSGADVAGGRNEETMRQQSGRRVVKNGPKAVTVTSGGITIEFFHDVDFGDGAASSIDVDQYVFAIGSDTRAEGGADRIVEDFLPGGKSYSEMCGQLKLIHDKNQYFEDTASNTVIGLSTDDNSLIVVGSAVFSTMRAVDSASRGGEYAHANQSLPTSARPPEGIPTIVATIEALNHYVPATIVDRVNLNIANRTQLAIHIAARYPEIEGWRANELVEEIIAQRTSSDTPFGLDTDAIRGWLDEFERSKCRGEIFEELEEITQDVMKDRILAAYPRFTEDEADEFAGTVLVDSSTDKLTRKRAHELQRQWMTLDKVKRAEEEGRADLAEQVRLPFNRLGRDELTEWLGSDPLTRELTTELDLTLDEARIKALVNKLLVARARSEFGLSRVTFITIVRQQK